VEPFPVMSPSFRRVMGTEALSDWPLVWPV